MSRKSDEQHINLSAELIRELEVFFEHEEIRNIFFDAHVCLLSSNTKGLALITDQRIKDYCFQAQLKLSHVLKKQLKVITIQILENLKLQKVELLNQIASYFFNNCPVNQAGRLTFNSFLQKQVHACRDRMPLAREYKIEFPDLFKATTLPLIEELDGIHLKFFNERHALTLLVLLFSFLCICMLAYIIYKKIPIIAYIGIALLFLGILWAIFDCGKFDKKFGILFTEKMNVPEYRLETIKIYNREKNEFIGSTFVFATHHLVNLEHQEISSVSSLTEKDESENDLPKSTIPKPPKDKQEKLNQKSTISKPISTSFNLSWPGVSVLFGDKSRPIKMSDTREMEGNIFSKNIRYFSFFNRKALLKQGLTSEDNEWKNYEKKLDASLVVPPTHRSGIKLLKPAFACNVTIKGISFGKKIFHWEVKNVTEVYRALGCSSSMQLSADGRQNVLVDFCLHMDKGPGK